MGFPTYLATPVDLFERSYGTSYASAVAADSPLLHWRLGESSGSNANDETANNRDGTYAGSVTYSVTHSPWSDSNTGISLSGTSGDRITSSYSPFTTGGSGHTFEAWVNRTNTSGYDVIMGSGGSSGPLIRMESGVDTLIFLPYNGAGATWTSTGISDAEWHHVVVTFSGSAGRAELFVDSISKGAVTGIGDYITAQAGVFWVGDSGIASGSWPWLGSLDEVALYSGVLTHTRIREHWRAGVGNYLTEIGSAVSFSNSGFESGTPPTDWNTGSSWDTWQRSSGWAYSGTYSGQFSKTGGSVGSPIYPYIETSGSSFAVTPGKAYRVRARINLTQNDWKSGDKTGNVWIRFTWLDSGGSWLANGKDNGSMIYGLGVNTIENFDVAPPNATYARLHFFGKLEGGTLSGYIDEAEVHEVTWVTPYGLFDWAEFHESVINNGKVVTNTMYWGNAQYGGSVLPADQEVWVEVDGTGGSVQLFSRVKRNGSNYYYDHIRADFDHAGGLIYLIKNVNDSDTELSRASLSASQDGDILGITSVGQVVKAWRWRAGTITELVRGTTTAPTSGQAGFAQSWNVPAIKAFGAGAPGTSNFNIDLENPGAGAFDITFGGYVAPPTTNFILMMV